MDPWLALELEECSNNKMCVSRVYSMWEGKGFFQMVAYGDRNKFTNLLWGFEILVFGPSVETISAKSNGTSAVLQQTLAQVLVKKTIAFHKTSDLDSLELANNYIEKTVIPVVYFGVEKFKQDGSLEFKRNITLFDVSITKFKGKHLRNSDSETSDLVVLSFKDYK